MPIRPENRNRYPKDWKFIRERILLRADNKCEFCGVPDRSNHPKTGSLVILTIMHLDHVPENCDPENLKAACQKCHNSYDAPMRAKGIKERRRKAFESRQHDLMPEEKR